MRLIIVVYRKSLRTRPSIYISGLPLQLLGSYLFKRQQRVLCNGVMSKVNSSDAVSHRDERLVHCVYNSTIMIAPTRQPLRIFCSLPSPSPVGPKPIDSFSVMINCGTYSCYSFCLGLGLTLNLCISQKRI